MTPRFWLCFTLSHLAVAAISIAATLAIVAEHNGSTAPIQPVPAIERIDPRLTLPEPERVDSGLLV